MASPPRSPASTCSTSSSIIPFSYPLHPNSKCTRSLSYSVHQISPKTAALGFLSGPGTATTQSTATQPAATTMSNGSTVGPGASGPQVGSLGATTNTTMKPRAMSYNHVQLTSSNPRFSLSHLMSIPACTAEYNPSGVPATVDMSTESNYGGEALLPASFSRPILSKPTELSGNGGAETYSLTSSNRRHSLADLLLTAQETNTGSKGSGNNINHNVGINLEEVTGCNSSASGNGYFSMSSAGGLARRGSTTSGLLTSSPFFSAFSCPAASSVGERLRHGSEFSLYTPSLSATSPSLFGTISPNFASNTRATTGSQQFPLKRLHQARHSIHSPTNPSPSNSTSSISSSSSNSSGGSVSSSTGSASGSSAAALNSTQQPQQQQKHNQPTIASQPPLDALGYTLSDYGGSGGFNQQTPLAFMPDMNGSGNGGLATGLGGVGVSMNGTSHSKLMPAIPINTAAAAAAMAAAASFGTSSLSPPMMMMDYVMPMNNVTSFHRPNGKAASGASNVLVATNQSHILYGVAFKGNRVDIFHIPVNVPLRPMMGDMVIVDGDRGHDLGIVSHVNITVEEAKYIKRKATENHIYWLLLLSRRFIQTAKHEEHNGESDEIREQNIRNDLTMSRQGHPRHRGSSGCVSGRMPFIDNGGIEEFKGCNEQQQQRYNIACEETRKIIEKRAASLGGKESEIEIRPKLIRRLALQHEAQGLEAKERVEAQARKTCQIKVGQMGKVMEILDAEFQADFRKLTFYYYADEYVDFNQLVQSLFRLFKTRIWMSAVNPDSFSINNEGSSGGGNGGRETGIRSGGITARNVSTSSKRMNAVSYGGINGAGGGVLPMLNPQHGSVIGPLAGPSGVGVGGMSMGSWMRARGSSDSGGDRSGDFPSLTGSSMSSISVSSLVAPSQAAAASHPQSQMSGSNGGTMDLGMGAEGTGIGMNGMNVNMGIGMGMGVGVGLGVGMGMPYSGGLQSHGFSPYAPMNRLIHQFDSMHFNTAGPSTVQPLAERRWT